MSEVLEVTISEIEANKISDFIPFSLNFTNAEVLSKSLIKCVVIDGDGIGVSLVTRRTMYFKDNKFNGKVNCPHFSSDSPHKLVLKVFVFFHKKYIIEEFLIDAYVGIPSANKSSTNNSYLQTYVTTDHLVNPSPSYHEYGVGDGVGVGVGVDVGVGVGVGIDENNTIPKNLQLVEYKGSSKPSYTNTIVTGFTVDLRSKVLSVEVAFIKEEVQDFYIISEGIQMVSNDQLTDDPNHPCTISGTNNEQILGHLLDARTLFFKVKLVARGSFKFTCPLLDIVAADETGDRTSNFLSHGAFYITDTQGNFNVAFGGNRHVFTKEDSADESEEDREREDNSPDDDNHDGKDGDKDPKRKKTGLVWIICSVLLVGVVFSLGYRCARLRDRFNKRKNSYKYIGNLEISTNPGYNPPQYSSSRETNSNNNRYNNSRSGSLQLDQRGNQYEEIPL